MNNSTEQWTWIFGVILFVFIFKKYISKLISLLLFRIVKKTDAGELTEEFLHLILKPLQYFILLQTIYYGFKTLNFPITFAKDSERVFAIALLHGLYEVLFILNSAWLISRLGDFFVAVLRHRAAKTEDPWDDQLVDFLKDILRLLVWAVAFLSILGVVFHVNLLSILAGAGIAGIAIAFAAQETLQNVFGSISIFTEKPFVVGDLIEVDGISGKVIKVGFRSTRIRTTETAYMTVPNKNIVNNKLSNLKRRTSRRIQFTLALAYDTPAESLKKIVADISAYTENHPKKNAAGSVGLYNFGSYAVEIYVEFFLEYEEFEAYIATRNDAMFAIMQIVKNNNATFAYPIQKIVLDKNQ